MDLKKRLRKHARQAQTRAVNALETAVQGQAFTDEVKRLRAILRTRMEKLNALDDEVLADIEEDLLEDEYKATCDYSDDAITALSNADAYLSGMSSNSCSASASSSTSSQASTSTVALPKLHLPIFSGDSLEWRPFWSQFEAAVHGAALPDVQKLSHLVACLRGSALDAVRGVQVTGENYSSTVALLQKRFGDPSALIGLYASRLVSAPSTDDGAVGPYRSMIDSFSSALREIRTLSKEVLSQDPNANPYDLVLAPLLLRKLPPSSRLEWSRKHPILQGALTSTRS